MLSSNVEILLLQKATYFFVFGNRAIRAMGRQTTLLTDVASVT